MIHFIQGLSLLLLVAADLIFTYEQLFYMKIKGLDSKKYERGPIQRIIMNKLGTGTKAFLVGGLLNITIFSILLQFMSEQSFFLIAGVLITVNIYHWIGLFDITKYWNNEKFWYHKKKMNEVMQ